MVDIIKLAEGVAEAVGDGAVVALTPEFTLKDVKDKKRTVVVPVGVTHKMLARGIREDLLKVQIGVLRKATEDDLEKMVSEVQTLALSMLHKSVEGVACVSVEHAPLYDPQMMRERRQFTGVIDLTFRELNAHEHGG